jgi:hypothetical protein
MKKGRKTIKEATHMLMTKFDTLKKNRSVLFAKSEHPVFTVIRLSIFLNGCQFYIFQKLNHAGMLFRLCTCFSNNLVEFHSRNKELLQNTRIWTQTEDFKPP